MLLIILIVVGVLIVVGGITGIAVAVTQAGNRGGGSGSGGDAPGPPGSGVGGGGNGSQAVALFVDPPTVAPVLTVDVDSSATPPTITLSTNEYPGYEPDYALIEDGGFFAAAPGPQSHSATITLRGRDLDAQPANPVVVHNPTFGEVGFVGRPHDDLPDGTHWSSTYKPKEVIGLDPMPAEAINAEPGRAGSNYTGKLRLSVLSLVKSRLADPEVAALRYDEFNNKRTLVTGPGPNGDNGRLGTDSYYAHTQPVGNSKEGGIYHYHGFRAGEYFDLANKVVGYAVDGYAIMGHGTRILQSRIIDGVAALGDQNESLLPAESGYRILPTVAEVDAARGRIGIGASGAFHVDYAYDETNVDTANAYPLDAYNMGFCHFGNNIERVYVCTEAYPYTLHTLFGVA